MHLSQWLLRVYCSSDIGSHSYSKQIARGLLMGLWWGGPWKAATPQPLSLAIAGAPYGACVCAQYLGRRIPTPESGKDQVARGGAGEWDRRRMGCRGDGSLLLKSVCQKRKGRGDSMACTDSCLLGFSHKFSSSFPIHTVNCFGRARGYLENRRGRNV